MRRPSLAIPLLLFLLVLAAGLAPGDGRASPASARAAGEATPRAYLPIVRQGASGPIYDMAEFIVGSGALYEVWQLIPNPGGNDWESQARHQTQFDDPRFYHTKGNELHAEWEELWIDQDFVYRGTDTSPGNGQYYTLREGGQYGSKWSPRYWRVGDVFERNPQVTFYNKSDCAVLYDYPFTSWLKLLAYYPEHTFSIPAKLDSITVQEVIELAWLLTEDGQPEERYFYARDLGLVGWANNGGSYSRVSEIHDDPNNPRPDNKAEVIPCLDMGSRPAPDVPIWPDRPLEPPYRPK